ncbi:hypothetical protein ACWENS_05540 [Streptomyces sp. NPDC004532]
MNAPTVTRTAAQAAADLTVIREQWPELLAAIERVPAAEWPPRETRSFLDQRAAADRTPGAAIGRTPLTLREHPAPVNLDALGAALAVERGLFDLADVAAATVQRPVRTWIGLRGELIPDTDDRNDPARWHLPTHRDIGPGSAASAGSRAHGVHWAVVWLEGRVWSEQQGDLFRPTPVGLLDHMATVARTARSAVERALQRDDRTTVIADPCPWCGGTLTGRMPAGDVLVAAVTCSTGEGCGAPVPLVHGRRMWRGAELAGLHTAMDAARKRAA